MANFAIGLVLGVILLGLVRLPRWLNALAALGRILFAAGTLAALVIAEQGTLIGFHEHGYRPAIVLSIIFEGLAAGSLAM